jgi:hypothetical protein
MTDYPRPWRIDRQGDYCTVTAANGTNVPMLTDVELGWTDTSTGPYVDPDKEHAELESILRAVNAHDDLVKIKNAHINLLIALASEIENQGRRNNGVRLSMIGRLVGAAKKAVFAKDGVAP